MGSPTPTVVGRYTVHDAIGSGGMATVHLGRMRGAASFARIVALKRLMPRFAADPAFVEMFLDETRLAARIKHPNVIPILDVASTGDELFMVMEYVAGESLWSLVRRAVELGERVPIPVSVAIVCDVLHGLHAAHEATDADGAPLGIVHRDVSPQNVLVGADGLTRLLDFGIAKARGQVHTTDQGQVKGKLRYMAPEQISRERPLGRTVDIYSTGVVLWELLSGRRLFDAESDVGVVGQVLLGSFARPSDVARERGLRTPEERAIVDRIEPVLTRALATEPAARFASAREMARALEGLVPRAPLADVAGWVDHVAGEALRARAALVASLERGGQALASLASADEPTAVGADAATTNPPSRPLMRRPLVIVGAVLAATVVLGLLVARAREGNARVDPRAAPAAIKADPPAPSAATASTAATASSSAPPIVRDAPPKAPAVPATPHRTDACKPPYTWDAQGVKHFKPECM